MGPAPSGALAAGVDLSISGGSLETTGNLADLLAERARKTSDGSLLLCVASGTVVVAAALQWKPWGWPAAATAGLCVASFGAWGIADRELEERAASAAAIATILLRALRTIAGVTGWLALVGFAFSAFAVAIGRWQS